MDNISIIQSSDKWHLTVVGVKLQPVRASNQLGNLAAAQEACIAASYFLGPPALVKS